MNLKYKLIKSMTVIACIIVNYCTVAGITLNCETNMSGDWDNPLTWTGCDGGYPDNEDKYARILNGHEITYDLSSGVVNGLFMESNTQLITPETNGTYNLTAEADDINTSQGKVTLGSSLTLRTNNGDVILGNVDGSLLNKKLEVTSGGNIHVVDSANGFNIFYFIAESTDPSGKIILTENITSGFRQYYNSLLELENSVTLTAKEIQISAGLNMENNSLSLSIDSSSNDSGISGIITSSGSDLIKSGMGSLEINVPVPVQVTTFVEGGSLEINNIHHGSVNLSVDAKFEGNGEIKSALNLNDSSILSPGIELGGMQIGSFTVDALNMSQNSTLEILMLESSGVITNDYIVAETDVNLGGQLSLSTGYEFGYEDVITVVDNQSNNLTNGLLNGVSEGGIIDDFFQISYQGGDGNDVVLTTVCGQRITVTNYLDNGPGSFRQAVQNVCDEGVIDFQDNYLITVDSTIELGDKFVTVEGSGQAFESSGSFAVFAAVENSFWSISRINIQNTTSSTGALVNHGTVILSDSYFSNNTNASTSGGGAITNFGNLNVYATSFYRNNASQGGAINNSDGLSYVSNSTFYQNGNLLTQQGGAIYNNAQFETLNVTIADSGNDDEVEGNSFYSVSVGSFTRFVNTVITNDKTSLTECYAADEIQYHNNNHSLISDGSCDAPLSGNAGLGTWGIYGGFSPTIPIMFGSRLINTGSLDFCVFFPNNQFDQLGNPRTNGASCDIGAVEFIDTEPPEIIEVTVAESPIEVCGSVPNQTNQIKITYNEPVFNSEDIVNYQLLHAGDDQSFLTNDDVVIEILAVNSDNVRPTPTVTLITSGTLPNGLIRLLVDGEITDEFNLNLYAGGGYQHPFRVDIGNQFSGGHFDNCAGVDPLNPWSFYTSDPVSLGSDLDGSNISSSLFTDIDGNQELIFGQCLDLESTVEISMSVYLQELFIDFNNPGITQQGIGHIGVFMACVLYEDENCSGGSLGVYGAQQNNSPDSMGWELVDVDFPVNGLSSESADCRINVINTQSAAIQIQLDEIRLQVKTDLIYSNGFDTADN